jgi:hypothetical protein
MKRSVWILCSVALCLGGCTSTIHKHFSIDEAPPKSLSLDAKQRLVLVTDKGGKNEKNRENKRVVCAEPSPDAIMGIAASGALEAAVGTQGSGKIAASLAEAIGELGDRTPTIQLLRDALYRACEAYMNGIFDIDDYRVILQAYNEFVVTLLAIEGLTQRPRSAPTIIQSKTEAKIANNPESQTIPTTGNQNQAPSSSGPVKPVSDEVAKVVRDILCDYYKLQMLKLQMFRSSEAGSGK